MCVSIALVIALSAPWGLMLVNHRGRVWQGVEEHLKAADGQARETYQRLGSVQPCSDSQDQQSDAEVDSSECAREPQQCPEPTGEVGDSVKSVSVPGVGAVLQCDADAGQQEQPGHAVGHYDLKAGGRVTGEDVEQCNGDRDRDEAEGRTGEVQEQEQQEYHGQPQDGDNVPEGDEFRRAEPECAWIYRRYPTNELTTLRGPRVGRR